MEKAVYSPVNLSILSKLSNRILWVLLGFILFFGGAHVASAASLYFSPASGSHTIGTTFAVGVYVSSTDQALNAVSGTVSFPANRLEVVSISKDGSIINFWVTEPSISNSLGTVNFEGVVLNPGYKGANGKIISIIFKAKAAGENSLSFSVSSVLANDGKGTNILTGIGNAKFICNNPISSANQPAESTTPALVSGTPLAPRISSPTHPLPEKWYNVSNPRFAWQLAGDIIAVRLLYDKNPNSLPRVLYEDPIDQKQLENLNDGIYYFHVQLKNKNGWGAISHFKFQIDTKAPEPFEIKFIDGNMSDNPAPTISLNAIDALSGIEYYRIKIGEGEAFSIKSDLVKDKPFSLPLQNPGKYTILVQAFDKAGNSTVSAGEFTVLPIKMPEIIDYPVKMNEGEVLQIRGKSLPNAIVEVFLKSENGKVTTKEIKSDSEGNFLAAWEERMQSGVYTLWIKARDMRGAYSDESMASTIVVNRKPLDKISSDTFKYLTFIISVLAITFALFVLAWYLWHKFSVFRRKTKRESGGKEQVITEAFMKLQRNVRNHLKTIESAKSKRELTDIEKQVALEIKVNLKEIEEFILDEFKELENK